MLSKGDIYFKKLLFSHVTITSIFQSSFQNSAPLACRLKIIHRVSQLTYKITLHLTGIWHTDPLQALITSLKYILHNIAPAREFVYKNPYISLDIQNAFKSNIYLKEFQIINKNSNGCFEPSPPISCNSTEVKKERKESQMWKMEARKCILLGA